MQIPLLPLLLQGIPEQTGVVTLAFIIAKLPLKWSKLLFIGIILAISAYLVRLLPMPFGLHTILLLILLFVFLIGLGKGDVSLSLVASLLSILALIVFETASLSLLMPLFKVTKETLLSDPLVRIVIFEPQVVLLFLTAFLVHKFLPRKEANL